MLASNAVRLVAVGALALIVLGGSAQLWMLYVFAVVFGVADAFFYPAQTAITPELVDGDQLQAANGITQGTAQLTLLIGPAIAGVIIAALTVSGAQPGAAGVGMALFIDALSFGVSLLTLLFIHPRKHTPSEQSSVIKDISEGFRFVWNLPALRVIVLIGAGLNLLIVGPIDVGLPYLAYTRLPEGAAAFGLIMSAFGLGSLIGLVGATVLPPLPPARFGSIVLTMVAASGLGVAGLAFATSTLVVLGLAAISGAILGYTNISMITWTQRRVPRALMGRVMSVLIFASVALVPISIAIAGVFVAISFEGLMLVSGLGMTVLTLSTLLSKSVRRMGLQPVLDEEAEGAEEADDQPARQPEPAVAG
jgi:hypothetical protein